MTDLTFEQIESAFPDHGAYTTADGKLQVSAQWMHDFARNIWAIRNGQCDECEKKQQDGWALYCVDCASSAKMGCNFPSCQPPEEQQRIAAQVHAELYSGIPPELLAIATGYESGTMVSEPDDLGGTIHLHYESPAE